MVVRSRITGNRMGGRRRYLGEDPAAVAPSPQAEKNDQARYSLRDSFERQIQKVLVRGQRFGSFDQIRQRHFWSSYLFAGYAGAEIPAGSYDVFRSIPGYVGQGYPVPLTTRETNWLGAGRVPDNQNFVITEVGVTLLRPPAAPQLAAPVPPATWSAQVPGGAFNPAPSSNSIAANLSAAQRGAVNGLAPIHPQDAQAILYGGVLEMSFLTNSVPIGLLADFSQSGGNNGFRAQPYGLANLAAGPEGAVIPSGDADVDPGYAYPTLPMGDPVNGVPAASFRRKLEVPILLQHGEQMGMKVTFPRPVYCLDLTAGGCGWFEIRVDWWATESFAELS